MARIIRANIFVIEADFVTPYRVTEGLLVSTQAILLQLIDCDGVEGWGEANPSKTFTGESVEDATDALRRQFLPTLLECDDPLPGPVDAQLDALAERHYCAKGAISMALLDIYGKRLGVPVSDLMGGALRRQLPVLWPLSSGTADDDMRMIDTRAAQGFSHFMLKMGSAPVADDVARVTLLQQTYGTRIRLIADANQGWSRTDAASFVRGVAGSTLEFIEQPLDRADTKGMAALSVESAIPVSADEAVISLANAAELARNKAAKVFSIKSSKNGGPLRARKIAALAEGFGIRCYMNSMHEFGVTQMASLQLAATVPNLFDFGHAFMSTLRLAEDPTDFSSLVTNGTITLPDGPGMGLSVDLEHVRRMACGSYEVTREGAR
ncbi:mandelate racemase [Paracoccus pantotrophus]|uniref:enolase C-terminal domain-like protein n=1 Tax=Paracoccus pantotrophus TaxID=82367 RepID=UPI000E097A6C|nr:enolase C-terminal domain-like protein [Paracoccus pantotrophus]RDD92842.1 mandelate racemase [Paracoccus pantotrophus]WGR64187.1 mandelate racemase [Paracoccus pantotrophus]